MRINTISPSAHHPIIPSPHHPITPPPNHPTTPPPHHSTLPGSWIMAQMPKYFDYVEVLEIDDENLAALAKV